MTEVVFVCKRLRRMLTVHSEHLVTSLHPACQMAVAATKVERAEVVAVKSCVVPAASLKIKCS